MQSPMKSPRNRRQHEAVPNPSVTQTEAPPIGDTAFSLPENQAAKRDHSVAKSLAACSFYVVVSSAMVFVNKALSWTYGFRSTNLLLLMQMVWQICVLHFLRDGLAHGPLAKHKPDFRSFQWALARPILPVSLFYCLNTAVALAALREMSVPSYSMIKRLAPLFTLFLEAFMILPRKLPSVRIVTSLAVMTVGTLLVAKTDSKSTALGWVFGAASNVFQALYLVSAKKSNERGMSSLTVLYYHSILSLPCLVLIVLVVGEVPQAASFLRDNPHLWLTPHFGATLFAALSMGLLLNYALFLSAEITSATTTLVAGQFKALGQTIAGIFYFEGVDVTPLFLLGLSANVLGGFGYGWAKYRQMTDQ